MQFFKIGSMLAVFALAAACGGEYVEGEEDPALVAEDEAAIFGSDACKNVEIIVTNSFEDGTRNCRILVRSVEYYSSSEGRWLTEDLPNFEIAYGSSHTFTDQDLQYAENDTLTAFRVHFSYLETDGDWSDSTSQYINTPDDVCHADDNYSMTVD